MKYTCWGGPCDGREINLPPYMTEWNHVVPVQPTLAEAAAPPTTTQSSYDYAIYDVTSPGVLKYRTTVRRSV